MKKLILLSTTFLFCLQIVSAQVNIGSWKLKNAGISMGTDRDMIKNLDYEYMVSTGRNVDKSLFANQSFLPQDLYGGVCENPHFRAFATFEVPKLRGFDLNLAIVSNKNRLDGVYYHSTERDGSYLSFESMNDELAVEGTLQKSIKFLKIFRLTGGLGTNLGYSYGGQLKVYGANKQVVDNNMDRSFNAIVNGDLATPTTTHQDDIFECYDLRDGIHQRVFLQGGFAVIVLKKLDIGFDYRYGVGYRALFGSDIVRTKMFSGGLTTKWNF